MCGVPYVHTRNDKSSKGELYYKTTHAENHARGPCDLLILIAYNSILARYVDIRCTFPACTLGLWAWSMGALTRSFSCTATGAAAAMVLRCAAQSLNGASDPVQVCAANPSAVWRVSLNVA